jgi:Transketolase, thiamine diphosphate binding domain
MNDAESGLFSRYDLDFFLSVATDILYHCFEMTYSLSHSLERACIDTIRILSAETVQKAKSGHPGAPMGLAPLAFVLFTQHMVMNPLNSAWVFGSLNCEYIFLNS